MKLDGFIADLLGKPDALRRLSATLRDGNPWAAIVPSDVERVVLLGMGSSAYAAGTAAARMRARGVVAVSELASSRQLPSWGPGTLVVATLGRRRFGGNPRCPDANACRRAHGGAHQHRGFGHYATL